MCGLIDQPIDNATESQACDLQGLTWRINHHCVRFKNRWDKVFVQIKYNTVYLIDLAFFSSFSWLFAGIHFLVACYATLHPALSVRRSVSQSVRPSAHRSVTLYFFLGFCGFWPHCSCSNDLVTSIMAPAHPHATGVAVYPALFKLELELELISNNINYVSAPILLI